FNLGGQFSVDSFSFWNHNSRNGETGIQNVQVLFSTNGVDFTLLPGGPSVFARAMSDNLPPQIFSFTAVNATHFRFIVLSNYGDIFHSGFAEVGFNGVTNGVHAIPEPITMLLFGTGLAGIAAKMRRRRQAK
ncbi:MAG: PEP-CTERM sorting domain-containing protein, partial [Acidobacteria bacterium]|nr:PEP-CTERM sorting domain-containing protein [Acidobacteriota bacterium]